MKQTTREKILEAGVKLWPFVTYQSVASLTKITHPAVIYHFPEGTLKDAVAEHAVNIKNVKIVIQLMASNHEAVENLTPSERMEYLEDFRESFVI